MINCLIYGYEGQMQKIRVFCRREGTKLWVDAMDEGVGIRDVAKAMEPLFTTKPEKDRSGMGFTFMEAFMDSSGIGLIMGRYRMMGMRGDCIQATGVNSYIEKLLHLSGVYKFVEICGEV